jgi:hypothetical protein
METLDIVFSVLGGYAGVCLYDYFSYNRNWKRVGWKFNVLIGIAVGLANVMVIGIVKRVLEACW